VILAAALHFVSQAKQEGDAVFVTSWAELTAIFTPVTLLASVVTWWHHVNCIEKGCWRKGHPSPEHGHPQCRKHTIHPHPSLGGPSGGELPPVPQVGHGATS
jgi:hypothetical protein